MKFTGGFLHKVFAATIFFALVASATETTNENISSFRRFFGRVDGLTEYHFSQDVRTFSNHKNEEFRSAYLVSALTEFEAMMVSYDTIFHIGILYSNNLGMGRQNAAILFDPRESDYALVPFIEFRHKNINYNFGLDHRCYHQIDRIDRKVSPYWNELYIRASSANYRFQQYKKNHVEQNRFIDNFKWMIWAGHFIRNWGNMDKSILNGGHPFSGRGGLDLAYSFYKTQNWVFGAHNKMVVFGDTTGAAYWIGEFGLDIDLFSKKHSIGFFMNYNYEFPNELPLYLSKDRLFEWGIRWRY
jgi:hypothetical protein